MHMQWRLGGFSRLGSYTIMDLMGDDMDNWL